MADKSISDLPAASAIYDDDLFLLEQSGEAKNLRGALYKAYLRGFVDAASAASEEATAALAGVRDAINNIPEGAATPIVNDLTTGGTSMALSAEMGKVLKGELDTKVNPNLLDNWYFGNPVDQRGGYVVPPGVWYYDLNWSEHIGVTDGYYPVKRRAQSGNPDAIIEINSVEYVVAYNQAVRGYIGAGYTIDRWRNVISRAVLVTENGLQIGSSGEVALKQYAEVEKFGNKGICTLSVLINENTFRSVTGAFDTTKSGWQLQTWVGSVFVGLQIESGSVWGVTISSSSENTIKAVKLELGTQQTLAHQDANGNWVLNEIPDYNEQLLRCCMSKADSSDTYANNKQTAAAVNALPLDGSKAMTGALGVSGGYGRVTASSGGTAGVSVRSNPNDAANYTYIGVYSYEAIAKALKLYRYIDGTPNEYTVLHTGNKPSGSYTGNGSATSRTVDTKGVGDALLIYNSYNVGIITKYSSFAIATQGTNAGTIKTFKNPDLYFANGVLYCATADTWVNGNGTVYNYQVL